MWEFITGLFIGAFMMLAFIALANAGDDRQSDGPEYSQTERPEGAEEEGGTEDDQRGGTGEDRI